tara:strand:+ start:140 stop:475 length:336 start_codon:yes stop_codon:yes gene_type:complete
LKKKEYNEISIPDEMTDSQLKISFKKKENTQPIESSWLAAGIIGGTCCLCCYCKDSIDNYFLWSGGCPSMKVCYLLWWGSWLNPLNWCTDADKRYVESMNRIEMYERVNTK